MGQSTEGERVAVADQELIGIKDVQGTLDFDLLEESPANPVALVELGMRLARHMICELLDDMDQRESVEIIWPLKMQFWRVSDG